MSTATTEASISAKNQVERPSHEPTSTTKREGAKHEPLEQPPDGYFVSEPEPPMIVECVVRAPMATGRPVGLRRNFASGPFIATKPTPRATPERDSSAGVDRGRGFLIA